MSKEKTFWDNRVEKFGKLSTGYLNDIFYEYDDLIRWKLFRKYTKLKKGNTILDVGCNHGKWSYKLYDLHQKVVGFDISSKAIELAKKNKHKRKIEFFDSKVSDISFKDETFNNIVSITVLQHILNKKEFQESVKKLVKATKIGGEIFIIESAPMKKRKIKLEYKEEWQFQVFKKEFEKNGCKLVTSKGIDYLGYYIFCFFDIFFHNSTNSITRVLQKICLTIAKPIDLMLINSNFLTKYSNTKMLKFKRIK